ncbi:MAG: sulfite exporter TauE/SafE family protein, partial [Tepidimonas ignava]
ATFALAGAIAWGPAVLMMAAATAGGYAGARGARRLPAAAVRAVVIGTGIVMSAVFFWRG